MTGKRSKPSWQAAADCPGNSRNSLDSVREGESEAGRLIRPSAQTVEVLKEGQECPFCNFARLKREGDEVVCPVCGYGRWACT